LPTKELKIYIIELTDFAFRLHLRMASNQLTITVAKYEKIIKAK